MTWNQEKKIEMSPEKAEMMELAGKGIKIAITNLNNRFKDVKGKHELNYERNRRHKKKTPNGTSGGGKIHYLRNKS